MAQDHNDLRCAEVQGGTNRVVIIGRPATECSTLDRFDFIRVPRPAAISTIAFARVTIDSFFVAHSNDARRTSLRTMYDRKAARSTLMSNTTWNPQKSNYKRSH